MSVSVQGSGFRVHGICSEVSVFRGVGGPGGQDAWGDSDSSVNIFSYTSLYLYHVTFISISKIRDIENDIINVSRLKVKPES